MSFRASFCDPFSPDTIDLGPIQKDQIIPKFESTNWGALLQKMDITEETLVYFSPSLEFGNTETHHSILLSAVGDVDDFKFYIFYKRPKKIKSCFGLRERTDENYVTKKTHQSGQTALDCLNAFLIDDYEYLASKIGR